ncbi:MAG: Fumarate hydratase class I, aerobic [Syntrophus sp. PtaU1.Bin005]|mgnify:FL=1|jgi:fumarate hydratase subunit beta|uniref:Fe-S-containing hydro-lyase n=1 Tax=Syntrophus sp. (in: bacteria) TaxID=48412 RepID=UPI0009D12BBE|nr:MAG: Fumarate hydratase class I, aerobic [Syntrophus sp. PtaB.Bin138]OPY79509.1 MAG: Fumarate hydratase class I, aerobic [Syntrophus sp. PtaU1.Bin005]
MTSEPIRLETPLNDELCERLSVGDRVLLSGVLYTGRDAAHHRLCDAAVRGEPLPFPVQGAVIFYAGPAPAKPGAVTGSIGPTTSYRMDPFAPRLMALGLKGMIGKGRRSPEVVSAMKQYKAVYFGAIGGIAALTARCIRESAVVAYEDLGPEAIFRLVVFELPLVVINDTKGRDLYDEALKTYSRT